jgi:hypothetical protein
VSSFLFSLVTAYDVLRLLLKQSKITKEIHDETLVFFSNNNCTRDPSLKIYQNGFDKKTESEVNKV